tara:strand:+ start:7016 stop:7603 length:588 start_codon:yes stop_codon:yes gene_type:complete
MDKLVSFKNEKIRGDYVKTAVILKKGRERVLIYNGHFDENYWSCDEFYKDKSTGELFYMNYYTSTWDKWDYELDAIQKLLYLQSTFLDRLEQKMDQKIKSIRKSLINKFSELPAEIILNHVITLNSEGRRTTQYPLSKKMIRAIVSNCIFEKHYKNKSYSYVAWLYGGDYPGYNAAIAAARRAHPAPTGAVGVQG